MSRFVLLTVSTLFLLYLGGVTFVLSQAPCPNCIQIAGSYVNTCQPVQFPLIIDNTYLLCEDLKTWSYLSSCNLYSNGTFDFFFQTWDTTGACKQAWTYKYWSSGTYGKCNLFWFMMNGDPAPKGIYATIQCITNTTGSITPVVSINPPTYNSTQWTQYFINNEGE